MKHTLLKTHSLLRAHRPLAVALLFGFVGAATVSAQSSTTPASGSGAGSTSGAAGTNRSAGPGSYGSSDTRSASDPTRATDNSVSLKRSDRRFLMKALDSNQKEIAMAQLAAQRATSSEVREYAQHLVSEHQKLNGELMQLAQQKGVTLDATAMGGGKSWSSGSSTTDSSTNAGIAQEHGAPRATGAAGTAGTGAATGVQPNASTATSGTVSSGAGRTMSTSAGMMAADATSDRHYRNLAARTGTDFDREFVDTMVDEHESDVQLFQTAAKNAKDSEIRTFASSHVGTLQSHLDQANGLMKSAAE